MTQKKIRIQKHCPACGNAAEMLVRGVCGPCRDKFLQGHRSAMAKGVHWREQDNNYGHRDIPEHDRWADEQRAVCIDDIPEQATPSDDPMVLATQVIRRLLDWSWKRGAPKITHAAFTRFAAMTAVLRPDLLEDKTFQEVGEMLGVSKATMSKYACEFSDTFGIQCRRSRSRIGRANMSHSKMGHPPTRCRAGGGKPDKTPPPGLGSPPKA